MNPAVFYRVRSTFSQVLTNFNAAPAMRRLRAGGLSTAHYHAALREAYFHLRAHSETATCASIMLTHNAAELSGTFSSPGLSGAVEECLLLSDLAALGTDCCELARATPLANTVALNAFAHYQVVERNPVGYVGYLFFLAMASACNGRAYASDLAGSGVPRAAMRFLDHQSAEATRRSRFMRVCCQRLIRSDRDLAEVIFAMRVTAKLYADLLTGAFDSVDTPAAWSMPDEQATAAQESASGVSLTRRIAHIGNVPV